MSPKNQPLPGLSFLSIFLKKFAGRCLVVSLLFFCTHSKAANLVSSSSGISQGYKLTYKNSLTDEILFQSDDLSDMWSYIKGNPINGPRTLQFNTSDVFLLNETLFFAFNNQGHLFTVAADG